MLHVFEGERLKLGRVEAVKVARGEAETCPSTAMILSLMVMNASLLLLFPIPPNLISTPDHNSSIHSPEIRNLFSIQFVKIINLLMNFYYRS
jgi:hypothetical protein